MDANVWRIGQLEDQVEKLEAEIQKMKLEREYLLGMSRAGKLVVGAVLAFAGYGGVRGLISILHWLNMPMK